jgi:hypothetical protein
MDKSTPLIMKSFAAPAPAGALWDAHQACTIVSPRDTASGVSTSLRSPSIIAVLIG